MSPTNSSIAYPVEAEAFWVGQAELVAEKLGDEALERMTPAVAQLVGLFVKR